MLGGNVTVDSCVNCLPNFPPFCQLKIPPFTPVFFLSVEASSSGLWELWESRRVVVGGPGFPTAEGRSGGGWEGATELSSAGQLP
jgi:hypothetical protein